MTSSLPAIACPAGAWIVGNRVSDCSLGIETTEGSWAKGNRIEDCTLGMRVALDNGTIESNTLSRCATGILVEGSGHALFGNRISACDLGLENALGSTGNRYYLNSFLGNLRQARNDHPDGNLWDDGSRGNYWSDYSGGDADRNGIGDRGYEIQPGSVDRYPLMQPFHFPDPIITANNSRGLLTCGSDQALRVTIELDPGSAAGLSADWWIGVLTPFQTPYNLLTLSAASGWQLGVYPYLQVPLAGLESAEILDMVLPAGKYLFFFLLDSIADGNPAIQWWDWVDVLVE